ncbi:MAG TPA: response regulator [Lachnospiraceae bacterium]|nr:response regulator [Lachnospiraceae bacterium]
MKVFLVEDEVVVREGIKRNIDWEKEGYEFVGEASDGELAYPLIQKEKPDILITDIKMPFMNGLELSRLVKNEMPWVQIIILSGYDDFQYAKESISIGVTDYISKPITGDCLLKAVNRVREVIRKQREQEENMERLRYEMRENEKVKRQKFFSEIVSQRIPLSELLENAKKLEIDLTAKSYNTLLFRISLMEEESLTYSEVISSVKYQIMEHLDQMEGVFAFERGNEDIALLVKDMESDNLAKKIQDCIDYLVDVVMKQGNLEYFIGVGQEVSRLSELYKSYHEASRAFAYRYILDRNMVVHSSRLEEYQITKDSGIDIKELDIKRLGKSEVSSFLMNGNEVEVESFIENYFNKMGDRNMESLLFRQYIAMDMYICCLTLLEKMGIEHDFIEKEHGRFSDVAAAFTSLRATKQSLQRIFLATIRKRNEVALGKYRGIVETAKDYIASNYAREDISLNQVAGCVNISPSHFSTIFSQEVGETFIEYLTSVRMSKAKELLRCSNLKSSEVGYAVGYKDPHYFSYIFKKTQNCTPKEYRNGR